MPTTDELHEADKKHEAAIAALREQVTDVTASIERHEHHLERLDECMEEMRTSLATREDIRDLRADLRDRFDHYRVRMDAIEGGQQERTSTKRHFHSNLINLVMVALFVVEVVIAIAQYQWMHSHG